MGEKFSWTDETINKLKQYIKQGHNTNYIAYLLNTTRGSIAGKVDRLGLSIKGNNNSPKSPLSKKSEVKRNKLYGNIKSVKKREVDITLPIISNVVPFQKTKHKRVKLFDYEDTEIIMSCKEKGPMKPPQIPHSHKCKWIDGDVKAGTAIWCCAPTWNSTSWCKEHYKRVYELKKVRVR